jgi:sigma-B regulation protein RsbU (phosphoserine phosphatase)
VIGALLALVVMLIWLAVTVARRGRRAADAVRGAVARNALTQFAAHSLELDTVGAILELAAQAARVAFGSARTVAFEPGLERGTWEARSADGPAAGAAVAPPLRSLFAWLKHNDATAAEADLGDARFGAMRGPLAAIMAQYEIDVLMPLVHRGEVLAVIGLALRRAPSPLDRELMRLFRMEATAACANVRLHLEASHAISLAREVDLASVVQRALVPPEAEGRAEGLEWAGHFRAAGDAGSDFWSAYPIAADRLLVLIGDATGGGLGGSMVSAVVKSCSDAIIDARADEVDPAALLGALNRALWRPERPVHMRCFAALFDRGRGEIRYANAGHLVPYRVSADGTLGALVGAGPVLGDEPQSVYRLGDHALAPGDAIVLYTDGLVEMTNRDSKSFGERRLQKLVTAGAALGAVQLRDIVVREVTRHRGAAAARDDETVVVVKATR